MAPLSKESQIQEWSRLYNRPISEQELTEIYNNLNGFFSILRQWSEDEKNRTKANSFPLEEAKAPA